MDETAFHSAFPGDVHNLGDLQQFRQAGHQCLIDRAGSLAASGHQHHREIVPELEGALALLACPILQIRADGVARDHHFLEK